MYVLLTLPSIMLFLPSVPISVVCRDSSSISCSSCIGLDSVGGYVVFMYTNFRAATTDNCIPVYLTSKTVNNTSSSSRAQLSRLDVIPV